MLRFLLLLFFLPLGAKAQVEDKVTSSPHGTFRIVQHYYGDWSQVLRFTKAPNKPVNLEEEISWPAFYYISPDEHWVLRIQKSGSGDNISWLYHVDAGHHVHRMDQQVGALGFAYLRRIPGLPRDLYHTGIEFVSWDLENGILHFTIHGSDTAQSGHGINRSLSCNLKTQTVISP